MLTKVSILSFGLAVLAALFIFSGHPANAAGGEESDTSVGGWCHFDELTPPGRPAFTGATPGETSITFTWSSAPNGSAAASGGVITDYTIYLTTDDGTPVSRTIVITGATYPENYSQVVSGLLPGKVYKAKLRARTIFACYSAFSEVETVTTTGS